MLGSFATTTISICGAKGAACSLAPATTSALLFVLCELYTGSSSERSLQLLSAAIGLAVLAAVHTHTVLGSSLQGWRYVMPFQGGVRFMRLQALGWMLFALVLTLGLYMMSGLCTHCASTSGMTSALGFVQLIAQVSLVFSLSQFDTAAVCDFRLPCIRRCGEQGNASSEGMPLVLVGVGVLAVGVAAASVILTSSSPAQATGWTILAFMGVAQALGLHIMWTITWNILSLCAYLIGNESALAVMACMGFANINFPWYVGRVIFWKFDFATRAMKGVSHWGCLELLGLHEYPLTEDHLMWGYWAFLFVDQALHLLPGMLLLQYSALTITPASALIGIGITALWLFTVSLHHNVVDWKLFRQGRLKYMQWGDVSLFEPRKIGQIYLFDNELYTDNGFMRSVPGFMSLFGVGTVTLLYITALPDAASIFFVLGGGPLVSMRSLVCLSFLSFFVGIALMVVVLVKGRAHYLRPKVA